jgi:hypothetical protein
MSSWSNVLLHLPVISNHFFNLFFLWLHLCYYIFIFLLHFHNSKIIFQCYYFTSILTLILLLTSFLYYSVQLPNCFDDNISNKNTKLTPVFSTISSTILMSSDIIHIISPLSLVVTVFLPQHISSL